MENLLKIKVDQYKDRAIITILEQAEWLRQSDGEFVSSLGIHIESEDYPEFTEDNYLFLRGVSYDKDKEAIEVPIEKLNNVLSSLKEWKEWLAIKENRKYWESGYHVDYSQTNIEEEKPISTEVYVF